MPDLRAQLQQTLSGPVCLVGLGNTSYGDDAAGVVLAQALECAGHANVIVAGTRPERWLTPLESWPGQVLLLDAVEFGGRPGDIVWLGGQEIIARFPQVSTHKLSLGLLARAVEQGGQARVWLLGIQPQSLHAGAPLSLPVARSVRALAGLLSELLPADRFDEPGFSSSTRGALTARPTATDLSGVASPHR